MSEKVLMRQIPITERGLGLTLACQIAGIADSIFYRDISPKLSFDLPRSNRHMLTIKQVKEVYEVTRRLRNTQENGRAVILPRRIPVEVEFLPTKILIYRVIL